MYGIETSDGFRYSPMFYEQTFRVVSELSMWEEGDSED